MKKIVRLTESDLVRLVKRVIKEQENDIELSKEEIGANDIEKGMVYAKNKDAESVQEILNNLPDNLQFLALVGCESADFSDVDLCSYENLVFVNLKGTPNNLEEFVSCEYENVDRNLYDFTLN